MKKLFIPLTLENVGSTGKFFTDKNWFKLLGCLVLSIVLGLIVWSQLSNLTLELLGVILGILTGLISLYYEIRYIVIEEKKLKKHFQRSSKNENTPVGEFSDKYDFVNYVTLHNSGHMSCCVQIIRGSTIGMSEEEIESYYKCFQAFEDSILADKYQLKVIDMETPTPDTKILDEQMSIALRTASDNLRERIVLKNKWLKTYMKNIVKTETLVYVVIGVGTDYNYFYERLKQKLYVFNNPHISEVKILNEKEMNNFKANFFEVQYFEESIQEEELEEILKINDLI